MSVEVSWDKIASGEDGLALAEKIRDFVHEKFQQITLPKFINSVHVHAFDLGSVSPQIEVKDICDPLPDFYEDEDSTSSNADQNDEDHVPDHAGPSATHHSNLLSRQTLAENPRINHATPPMPSTNGIPTLHNSVFQETNRIRANAKAQDAVDDMSRVVPRSNTPGIPGGTSNMSYFHFPMGGLSGTQTPLAAVASGGPFPSQNWHYEQPALSPNDPTAHNKHEWAQLQSHGRVTSPPRTAGSVSSPELGSPILPSSPEHEPFKFSVAEKVSDDITLENLSMSDRFAMPSSEPDQVQPNDLQVVARVKYDGDVKMMLTAQILLDYPMPSFVSIPLKLSITGVSFDGVAILAYIRKRMHFCFLDPEDANTLVGSGSQSTEPENNDSRGHQQANTSTKTRATSKFGGLLQEIHVETEIGRQENGKQVLKNVGKVEKFVLEQVRRIFEEEFVFPSFWTFLV